MVLISFRNFNAMYEIEVNKKSYQVTPEASKPRQGLIDGKPYEMDFIKVKDGEYHVLWNNKSYNIELIRLLDDEKHMELPRVYQNKAWHYVRWEESLKALEWAWTHPA